MNLIGTLAAQDFVGKKYKLIETMYSFLRKLLEHRNRINSRDKAGLPAQPRRPAPAPPSGKDKNKKKKETTKRRPAPAAPTTSASTWDTAVKGLGVYDQTMTSVCLLYIFAQ